METDPIKRSLEAIDQELEDAMSHLNNTNQRVDDLLNEYNSGELSVPRPVTAEPEESTASVEDDEPPPEY